VKGRKREREIGRKREREREIARIGDAQLETGFDELILKPVLPNC
jgi:hypothetical protein